MMKTAPVRPRRRIVRPPAFHPVPLRARADGWTPRRQAEFIGHLALTRSVAGAARRVGMSRVSAYRLRRRVGADGFAAAWDRVMGYLVGPVMRKVTGAFLADRVESGLLRPVLRGGRLIAVMKKADNSALLGLLAQIDRASRLLRATQEDHGFKTANMCQPARPYCRSAP